jgi:hypothetical protein
MQSGPNKKPPNTCLITNIDNAKSAIGNFQRALDSVLMQRGLRIAVEKILQSSGPAAAVYVATKIADPEARAPDF